MFLLDTHVWIWTVAGDTRRIGPRTRRMMKRAIANTEVAVSAASVFEISALVTSGRLNFDRPASRWIDDAVQASRARVFEITTEIALDAGNIARTAIGDPLDRLIVAAARDRGATLVTCDRALIDYLQTSQIVRYQDAGS